MVKEMVHVKCHFLLRIATMKLEIEPIFVFVIAWFTKELSKSFIGFHPMNCEQTNELFNMLPALAWLHKTKSVTEHAPWQRR